MPASCVTYSGVEADEVIEGDNVLAAWATGAGVDANKVNEGDNGLVAWSRAVQSSGL